MRLTGIGAMCVGCLLAVPVAAAAQSFEGFYLGGFVGGAMSKTHDAETVQFDTNLDGTFSDTVRTAAGADAFSPGFCGGIAVNAMAASGCSDDDARGFEGGGRVGYDWRRGWLVAGGVFELSRTSVSDSVSAFSTTPAFYTFTREARAVMGLRARAGIATDRLLVYGTAGPAWGSIRQSFTTSNAVNTFVATERDANDDSSGIWGYQAGAGVEVALTGRIGLFGEYLFASFDDRDDATIRSQGPAPATNPFILVNASGTDLRRTDTLTLQSVRAGLTYRF